MENGLFGYELEAASQIKSRVDQGLAKCEDDSSEVSVPIQPASERVMGEVIRRFKEERRWSQIELQTPWLVFRR